MVELTDAQIDAARERGKSARRNEPRAAAARYDRRRRQVVVELTNGCSFMFPPASGTGAGNCNRRPTRRHRDDRRGIRAALGGARRRSVSAWPVGRIVRNQGIHGGSRRARDIFAQGRGGAAKRRERGPPAQDDQRLTGHSDKRGPQTAASVHPSSENSVARNGASPIEKNSSSCGGLIDVPLSIACAWPR